ncbi:hypothetical protein [Streptomyces sp. NPDC002851]
MFLTPARRRRSAAVRLVLGVLMTVFGLGLLCVGAVGAVGGAGAASGGAAAGGVDAVRVTGAVSAPVTEVTGPVAKSADGDGNGVGCGKRDPSDRGSQPGAPTRGGSAYEQLLTTLAYAHGAPGTTTPDGALTHAVAPDRGPPPRDPPTHVELSVLRV